VKFELTVWEPAAQETNLQPAWRQNQERVISSAGWVRRFCPLSTNAAVKRARTALQAGLMKGMMKAAKKLEMLQVQSQQGKAADQDNEFIT